MDLRRSAGRHGVSLEKGSLDPRVNLDSTSHGNYTGGLVSDVISTLQPQFYVLEGRTFLLTRLPPVGPVPSHRIVLSSTALETPTECHQTNPWFPFYLYAFLCLSTSD